MIAERDDDAVVDYFMKRQHLPYLFTSNCPECGKKLTSDYTEDKYLLEPTIGEVDIEFVCPDCQTTHYETATLDIVVSVVKYKTGPKRVTGIFSQLEGSA